MSQKFCDFGSVQDQFDLFHSKRSKLEHLGQKRVEKTKENEVENPERKFRFFRFLNEPILGQRQQFSQAKWVENRAKVRKQKINLFIK